MATRSKRNSAVKSKSELTGAKEKAPSIVSVQQEMIQVPLSAKDGILAMLKQQMNQKIALGRQTEQSLKHNKQNLDYYLKTKATYEKTLEECRKDVESLRETIREIEGAGNKEKAA